MYLYCKHRCHINFGNREYSEAIDTEKLSVKNRGGHGNQQYVKPIDIFKKQSR